MKWSLAIATYNRRDALQQCLALAVRQSRPPDEIVVVDASDDWITNQQIANQVVGTSVRYAQAKVRGSSAQRNQAAAIATGDVLFLIDDDSFMHQDCAEEIMKVYEADTRGCVAGVGATSVGYLPGVAQPFNQSQLLPSIADRINRFFERELYADRLLLPYDRTYPVLTVPPELYGLEVAPTHYFDGFRMTFRAPIIRQVAFDESLRRYSSAEDMDASYRASRLGVLLNAFNAKIFHAKSPHARLSRYTRELLGRLNLAYLYRRNGYDPRRLMRSYRLRLLRRSAIDILRDVAKKRASFPCARADFRAIALLPKILLAADDRIEDWYAQLQDQILDRNAA